MRRLLWLGACLALAASLSACTSSTPLGSCLGLDDDAKRDPALQYDVDVGNVVVAVIFVETIIVPLVVAFGETYCPIARRAGR